MSLGCNTSANCIWSGDPNSIITGSWQFVLTRVNNFTSPPTRSVDMKINNADIHATIWTPGDVGYGVYDSVSDDLKIGHQYPYRTGWYYGLMGEIYIFKAAKTDSYLTGLFNATKTRYGL